MLSYQHAFHAGALADVHKHAVLAWVIDYLTRKDKPLTYIETHAGRGVYDLASSEARKTGEAAGGVLRPEVARWFEDTNPYVKALWAVRERLGETAYPGSPMIAKSLLRDADVMHLAELHPQEHTALNVAMGRRAHVYQQDGYRMAAAVCPPIPRRGLLLLDPSFEQKTEYDRVPDFMSMIHRKWSVGVLILWYPVLRKGLHTGLAESLEARFPDGLSHRVDFPPVKEGHGMIGSGLFIVNAPYGLDEELNRLSGCFERSAADC